MLVILSFVKFPFFSQIFLRFFKIGVAGVSLLYIIHFKYLNTKKQYPIIAFCGAILFSSFASYHLGVQSTYSVLYALMIYELFVFTDRWINLYGAKNYFQIMFFFFLVLCLCNDVFLILNINFDSYMLGNKFGVAYYHLLLLMFMAAMIVEKERRYLNLLLGNIILFIFVIFAVLISLLVDTNTGLIGILVFSLLYFLPNFVRKILANPVVSCIVMYLLSGTILFWDYILSLNIVKNIIVTVLHRSLSLTGRLGIYRVLYGLFRQRPLTGWGYETNIVQESIYGNAQNGIVHLAIQYGVIGVICFTFLIFWIMKKNDSSYRTMTIVTATMYSFFVMSTVEIVFSNIFFIVMAILYAFADKEKKDIKLSLGEKHEFTN